MSFEWFEIPKKNIMLKLEARETYQIIARTVRAPASVGSTCSDMAAWTREPEKYLILGQREEGTFAVVWFEFSEAATLSEASHTYYPTRNCDIYQKKTWGFSCTVNPPALLGQPAAYFVLENDTKIALAQQARIDHVACSKYLENILYFSRTE